MLTSLGLSTEEQTLYESLVPRLTVTVSELDPATMSTMDRLVALGLLVRLPGQPERVAVLPPENAFDVLVRSAQRELAEARLRMVATVAQAGRRPEQEPGLVETVRGAEAIVRAAGELERGARREVCACDAPPYLVDPNAPNTVEFDLLRQGVTYRVLYARRAVRQPGRVLDIRDGLTSGEQARVGEVPLKMALFDAELSDGACAGAGMAFVPLVVDDRFDTALIISEPTLVAALSTLFELYWERAVPLTAETHDEPEQDLLALLVSGLTDGEIATHLGWTERRVRQHVQRLKSTLDVDTRFQAGYQAVRRGWLR